MFYDRMTQVTATRNGSAWVAYQRLMHILAYDRIKCLDGRIIWYGEPSRYCGPAIEAGCASAAKFNNVPNFKGSAE